MEKIVYGQMEDAYDKAMKIGQPEDGHWKAPFEGTFHANSQDEATKFAESFLLQSTAYKGGGWAEIWHAEGIFVMFRSPSYWIMNNPGDSPNGERYAAYWESKAFESAKKLGMNLIERLNTDYRFIKVE